MSESCIGIVPDKWFLSRRDSTYITKLKISISHWSKLQMMCFCIYLHKDRVFKRVSGLSSSLAIWLNQLIFNLFITFRGLQLLFKVLSGESVFVNIKSGIVPLNWLLPVLQITTCIHIQIKSIDTMLCHNNAQTLTTIINNTDTYLDSAFVAFSTFEIELELSLSANYQLHWIRKK